ncbi:MAG TPA: glycosyltransferase [Bryobacteraceae bacterium]|nr:glycosyltransferase [Bryobacteraceae bacterium]
MREAEHWKERIRPYYLRWVYFSLFPEQRPAAFAACWQYPYGRLSALLTPPSPVGDLPDVVFFPMTDWHARIQRTQHLARAFARRGHRCIYLNPNLGREFERTLWFDRDHRLSRLEERVLELHVRLPREPVFHHRMLTHAESRIVAAAVEQVLRWMGSRRAVLIVSLPVWMEAARVVRDHRGGPLLYDCHDLLRGFANMAPEIVEAEAAALEMADLALFSSARLQEQWATSGRSLLVRNAVDYEHFAGEPETPDLPPVAGYAGALERWFDLAAVRAAATTEPRCRFVLAGRMEQAEIGSLAALPNVEFRGEVPYARLPEVYAGFRVGLIPFLVNELTLATNPIKLYEYFSRGMPVVTTALPEVEAFGDLVYVASSAAGFAMQVSHALAEQDPERRARRREVARRESWAARAEAIARAWQPVSA